MDPAADPSREPALAALRRRLHIGDREHALLEHEARAAAGAATAAFAPGALLLGKHRIERLLGEGGFARAFLARDEKLGRRVVLKIARLPDAQQTSRALREARLLASINHPNVVSVHDVEEVAGEVVIVLEHVTGGSLSQVMAKGPVHPATAFAIARDVLSALDALHKQGIVHRDVKPDNILLEGTVAADGGRGTLRAKLSDFGIASAPRSAATLTGATFGAGSGTVRYMSPEQARGAPATARSDLYSVGAVLYELLAGRPYLTLAGKPEFDARRAIQEEEPVLPIPGAPPAANAALRALLAKDPHDRPVGADQARRLLS